MKDVEVKMLDENELEAVKILKAEGFSHGEAMMLVALTVNGNVTMKELSVITGFPQPTVSMSLNKLAKKNYVNLTLDNHGGHYFKRVELLTTPVEILAMKHGEGQTQINKVLEKLKEEGHKYIQEQTNR